MKTTFLILLLFSLPGLAWIALTDSVDPDPKPGSILSARDERLMKKVGLQLYSLRNQFKTGVPGTLAKVKQFGFTNLETAGTYDLTPAQFRAALDQAGLRAVSMHAGYEKLRDDLDGVVKEAKALGVEYVVCPWIPHGKEFTVEDCNRAIAHFNQWGERLAQQGLHFGYHNHGYEFQPSGHGTLMDRIIYETKPQWVSFEMDVFWVTHPGQDPVRLLQKYPSRFTLMHLKDLKKGVTGNLSGDAPEDWDVVLGTGQTDWPALLRQANRNGVKYFFIEDETAEVEAHLPASLQYLRTLQN